MKPLYKTIAIIWTEYDPTAVDPLLTDLQFHAENEFVHISSMTCVPIAEPEKDPAWDGTDFFDVEGDEDGDPCASPDEPRKDKESTG